jgi:hypothetical protein
MIKKSPIGADAGDEIFMVACIQDRKKVLPQERFTTTKIYLENPIRGELIDHVKALVEGKFILFVLARFR